ncbi:sulfide/dihydroorotate dehydrogenase-like FAD/NAD-binding protein [Methanoculleus chikugoensis]|uniref:sulfide/dihydroorotate dehydrogenase-like FAD/NAD-binding protein n=1 Tax=Methanoculleus chikugoensis TaxID=118126 RepID=UPI0009F9CBCD|nr:sulfide/dihydroorotate dehydrogenase-like FAD/NAD-binding protein [Methanoculleus chikugoensis]NMA11394.1 sulfide/dihydroorotate dehydrogenase-like FAD/NAD-binding protein [Methanomicrobiales archaeon]
MNQLYKIDAATKLADRVYEYWIRAPQVAQHARAGQFIILRLHEAGERIPLTISAIRGDTVRVIFMTVGKTTEELATLGAGDSISDVVGPLGKPSEIGNYGTCCVIGGGVGIASTPLIAKELKSAGNHVIGIIGARSADLLILEDEMREICDELHITTDDGSKGVHGFAADVLKKLLAERKIDRVWIIGPAIMMKVTAGATVPYGVKTYVSLNPIMVDGTGMCGSCRVTVGGETKFACVDGPEFDAHQVDFAELMQRQRIYTGQEKASLERFAEHRCRCGEGGHHHE